MKVAFISNYLTHHQIPFCDAMYKKCNGEFRFIATKPMTQERKNDGWSIDERDKYEIRSYEKDKLAEAENWINSGDIVLGGDCPISFLENRINTNKPIFECSERILKTGRLHCLSPRAIRNIGREKKLISNKPIYMLCASAYTAGDYYLFGAYKNKCFKWGYFPQKIQYDLNTLIAEKKSDKTKILWCGRLLQWKHCDDIIKVCSALHQKYDNFELDIIGGGPEREKLELLVKHLNADKYIRFIGSIAHEEVRSHMEKANIYAFTSDFNEGWGAVLNEAMNCGCAVAASHAAGSVPYLIKDGINGLIYKSGNLKDLYSKIDKLLSDKVLCERIGRNAYTTIAEQWNADVAADRLIELSNAILHNNNMDLFKDGVCSKDGFLSNNWYRGK